MKHLKINFLSLLLCFLVAGCQSLPIFSLKTYRTNADELHSISINSDRIKQSCLFLDAEAENKWRHQYLMHILNDKNKVIEIMQPTNQDEDTCEAQIKKIEKILQTSSKTKLCLRGEMKMRPQDPKGHSESIHFGRLGQHKLSYESLTLDSVCNSKKCFSNNSVWVNTCPGFVKH